MLIDLGCVNNACEKAIELTRELICAEGMIHGVADKGWQVAALVCLWGIRPVLAGKEGL
jgi:hypothetical protein